MILYVGGLALVWHANVTESPSLKVATESCLRLSSPESLEIMIAASGTSVTETVVLNIQI